MNYYELLGLSMSASSEDIKYAYKRMAKKYHPDKNKESDATEKFAEITLAYNILSDDEKRKKYDLTIHVKNDFRFYADMFSSKENPNNANAADFSSKAKVESPVGSNYHYVLGISLEEAYTGCSKILSYTRDTICRICNGTGAKTTTRCLICNGYGYSAVNLNKRQYVCPSCYGSGVLVEDECINCNGKGIESDETSVRINIHKGILNGDKIIVNGKGNAGKITEGSCAGPHGDFVAQINIIKHELFTRDGIDLIYELPLTISDLILGTQCKIPVISGEKIDITIPPLTKDTTIFRLKGRGMKYRSGEVGALLVKIKIIIPSSISDEVKELYQKIRELETIQIDFLKND